MVSRITIIISWLIFLAYWLYNWRRVKPTLYTKNNFKQTSIIIFLLLAAAFLLKILTRSAYSEIICPHLSQICNPEKIISFAVLPLYLQIISSTLTIGGLIIAIIARRALGDNWSGKIDIKKNHRLITTGIYRRVRHPIYTGVLLMCAGTFLNLNPAAGAILFLFILSLLIYKLKKEEQLLTRHFPKEYPKYKRRTTSLLPFIF